MEDITKEKDKIRGFAGLINSVLIPLNENKKFQEKFSNKDAKILLNASNLKYAALIIIDHGSVNVKSIPNEPKTNLIKKKVGWNAFLEMDTQSFLAIAMGRISMLGVAKLWLTRKIRLRGIRKLLLLLKMFKLLTDYGE
ncbi:MAG: hypothetical protein JSV62_13770 [Promethearchaeota archaeon]|nr:MAG: hypothetical protein JSV62_13770 [Candidatus Lokiarchaeota archaeon]